MCNNQVTSQNNLILIFIVFDKIDILEYNVNVSDISFATALNNTAASKSGPNMIKST